MEFQNAYNNGKYNFRMDILHQMALGGEQRVNIEAITENVKSN
jgi:hypothetical protein